MWTKYFPAKKLSDNGLIREGEASLPCCESVYMPAQGSIWLTCGVRCVMYCHCFSLLYRSTSLIGSLVISLHASPKKNQLIIPEGKICKLSVQSLSIYWLLFLFFPIVYEACRPLVSLIISDLMRVSAYLATEESPLNNPGKSALVFPLVKV